MAKKEKRYIVRPRATTVYDVIDTEKKQKVDTWLEDYQAYAQAGGLNLADEKNLQPEDVKVLNLKK